MYSDGTGAQVTTSTALQMEPFKHIIMLVNLLFQKTDKPPFRESDFTIDKNRVKLAEIFYLFLSYK